LLAVHKDKVARWLWGKPPLRLTKVHTLLERDGVVVPYSTLRRYVLKELDWRKPEGTILLDDPPMGQEAQVDLGLMGKLVDETTGRKRNLWALLVTLSASRYMFVWLSWFQTTEAVCEGLDAAWAFFGGMPRTLVPDNMSSVVFKADALAPVLIDAFADYVQARGVGRPLLRPVLY
jgi:transposase